VNAEAATKFVPAADYLALEPTLPEKHEYVDGVLYAMGGGTARHAWISTGIITGLSNVLRGRPCRVSTSDLKVAISREGPFFYPDVTVVCGAPQFVTETQDALLNPKLIVEVLSPSLDVGERFRSYRQIASLEHYLLAAQDQVRVEHYRRQPNGRWLLEELGPGAEIELDALGVKLALDAVYAGVFDEVLIS